MQASLWGVMNWGPTGPACLPDTHPASGRRGPSSLRLRVHEELCFRGSFTGRFLSDRELRPPAAAVWQQHQAPQTQPREWVAPQERGRTSKHSFHPVPSHSTLPCWFLVFKAFYLLEDRRRAHRGALPQHSLNI